MKMKVNLKESYEIKFGSLKNLKLNGIVVTETNVNKYYKLNLPTVIFPAGEKNKTRETKQKVEDELIGLGINRDGIIIALGGGVTGDIAGFVASTLYRGIGYIQVPTTLLAMVDSSIGGKVAVDHPKGKNLIGSFYQPKLVYIDVETLNTLPKKEILNGLTEIIKHSFVYDKDYLEYLEKNYQNILDLDKNVLIHVIKRSIEIKARVVEKDEKESGLRKILNYGHTIGHAIELLSNFKLTHGEAVALGMYFESKIAVELGIMNKHDCDRQNHLLKKLV